MSGILPTFVTGSTVDARKKRLAAALQGADQSVQSCTSLDDATRASWGVFYAAAMTFCQSDSSSWTAAADTSQATTYEGELLAWQTTIGQKGCSLTAPTFDPNAPDSGEKDLVTLAKYAAIIVGTIGGVYLVGQVVQFIPKPVKARG